VLRAVGIATCDLCGDETDRFERQWRAHVILTAGGLLAVLVVCPVCGERAYGEDEAAWWN
jgi:hypothetical protein